MHISSALPYGKNGGWIPTRMYKPNPRIIGNSSKPPDILSLGERMSTPYRTVAFHTMGCKLNYSESSMLQSQMNERGFKSVKFRDGADYFVINSCSVTNNADRECRKIIRRAKRISPHSKIAVIGCYAQLKPEEIIDIDGVNLILGAEEKFEVLRK